MLVVFFLLRATALNKELILADEKSWADSRSRRNFNSQKPEPEPTEKGSALQHWFHYLFKLFKTHNEVPTGM